MKLPMLHTEPEEDIEVVDGVVCWDPEDGVISTPFEKRPDEYKVYETIQGNMNFVTMDGAPLFGYGTNYPPKRGNLRWDPVTERYERDPAYRFFDRNDSIRYMFQFGRGGGKTARMFGADLDDLGLTKDEINELKRMMKDYFTD